MHLKGLFDLVADLMAHLTKSLTYIKSQVAKNKYENGLLVVLLY